MNEATLAAIYGGLAGALVSGVAALFVDKRNRKQTYYANLVKLLEAHNWKLLEHNLDPGITVRDGENKVAVVCYQHLNILFFVWLNKSVVSKDGSIEGFKNWAEGIVKGANEESREVFRSCYRQILNNGDLYPRDFISWLETELSFSVKQFPEVINAANK